MVLLLLPLLDCKLLLASGEFATPIASAAAAMSTMPPAASVARKSRKTESGRTGADCRGSVKFAEDTNQPSPLWGGLGGRSMRGTSRSVAQVGDLHPTLPTRGRASGKLAPPPNTPQAPHTGPGGTHAPPVAPPPRARASDTGQRRSRRSCRCRRASALPRS